ncbi:MAG: uncharacterized protein JWO60_374 [Frankiales bacterium]|nr:uncharacterized protein [Frankiales bacterium]
MTKPLSVGVDLGADVETVFAALTGPGWPAALDARLHDGSTLVSAEPTPDGGVRLVQTRRLPDGIPSFLRAFAPQDGTVTQTDVWGPAVGGVRVGTWEVAFAGSPGEIKGDTRVEPTADGSRWVVTGTVKVRVPLVGGKAEGYLAPLVEKLVAKQGEVLRALVQPAG